MQYQYLGPTGLKVSRLSFGNWLTSNDPKAEENVQKCIAKAWEMGINYFDTAEIYGSPEGSAEIQMGKALKALKVPREKLVISTKLIRVCSASDTGKDACNQGGLSRKHLIEGLKNSLKRLQLEYVDIVFAHRFDHETPMEEICRGFNFLIEKGWAFYWGTSEWTAEEIQRAYAVCDKFGLIKPVVEQCQYNMLIRDKFESEYRGLFTEFKMGTTIWSPLAGGILTGKYNDGVQPGSRLASDANKIFYQSIFLDPSVYEKRLKQLKALGQIAKENKITQAQLALVWALYNQRVSTAIIGGNTPQQVEDCCKAMEFLPKYTKELDEKIEAILENTPKQITNWMTWQPFEKQR